MLHTRRPAWSIDEIREFIQHDRDVPEATGGSEPAWKRARRVE